MAYDTNSSAGESGGPSMTVNEVRGDGAVGVVDNLNEPLKSERGNLDGAAIIIIGITVIIALYIRGSRRGQQIGRKDEY